MNHEMAGAGITVNSVAPEAMIPNELGGLERKTTGIYRADR